MENKFIKSTQTKKGKNNSLKIKTILKSTPKIKLIYIFYFFNKKPK